MVWTQELHVSMKFDRPGERRTLCSDWRFNILRLQSLFAFSWLWNSEIIFHHGNLDLVKLNSWRHPKSDQDLNGPRGINHIASRKWIISPSPPVLYTCIPVSSALKGTLKGRSIYFALNRCLTSNNSLPFYDQPYPDLFLLGNSTRLTLNQVGQLVNLEWFSAVINTRFSGWYCARVSVRPLEDKRILCLNQEFRQFQVLKERRNGGFNPRHKFIAEEWKKSSECGLFLRPVSVHNILLLGWVDDFKECIDSARSSVLKELTSIPLFPFNSLISFLN